MMIIVVEDDEKLSNQRLNEDDYFSEYEEK